MSDTTTMTDEVLARIDAAIELILPEAQEYVKGILGQRIKTTQDNYGNVLHTLAVLDGEMAPLFLIAMVRAGYPQRTALQLVTLMGWPSIVAALIEREAK